MMLDNTTHIQILCQTCFHFHHIQCSKKEYTFEPSIHIPIGLSFGFSYRHSHLRRHCSCQDRFAFYKFYPLTLPWICEDMNFDILFQLRIGCYCPNNLSMKKRYNDLGYDRSTIGYSFQNNHLPPWVSCTFPLMGLSRCTYPHKLVSSKI